MPRKTRRLRCKATARNGNPCQRWAMDGSLVCAHHGGKAPLAQGKAAERIAETQAEAIDQLKALVPKAIRRAEAVLDDDEAKPADHLKAVEMILDRFIARKVQAEVEDHTDERDLDREIQALLEEQETG